MSHFAKALQALGLILLPVGLVVGLANGDTRTELMLLGVGACVFLIGKALLREKT